MLLTLAFLFTLIGASLYSIPISHATAPTYTDWNGYKGNNAFYLTTYLTNTSNVYFLPAEYSSWTTSTSGWEPNGVALGMGGSAGSGNFSESYREYYDASDNMMHIYIPMSTAEATNWYYGLFKYDLDYVQYSVNVTSADSNAAVNYESEYNSGINVTSTWNVGNLSAVAWDTIWYVLGSLPAPYGWAVSTLNYENQLYNDAGTTSQSINGIFAPGNFTDLSFGLGDGSYPGPCILHLLTLYPFQHVWDSLLKR